MVSAKMKEVRVAVVGSGYWGVNHIRNFYQLGALRLVCDLNKERLAEIEDLYPEIETTTDFSRLLKHSDIDAVVLATPAEHHYNQAKECLLAGKHVLVEKPITITGDEALDLIKVAEKQKKILMVGHLMEYHPAVLKLQELINSGELGEIRHIRSNRLNLGKLRDQENVLWALGVHDLSIILMLLGRDPVTISAVGEAILQEGIEDIVDVHLDFDEKVTAHIHASWLNPFKLQRTIVIGAKKMAVFSDSLTEGKLKVYDKGFDMKSLPSGEPQWVMRAGEEKNVEFDSSEPLNNECKAFLTAIQSGKPPISDGQDGWRVLRVMEAAQESIRGYGKPVNFQPPKPTKN